MNCCIWNQWSLPPPLPSLSPFPLSLPPLPSHIRPAHSHALYVLGGGGSQHFFPLIQIVHVSVGTRVDSTSYFCSTKYYANYVNYGAIYTVRTVGVCGPCPFAVVGLVLLPLWALGISLIQNLT